MTPEAQRIAIAEACGWTQVVNFNTMAVHRIWVGYPPKNQLVGMMQDLPSYLTDLNAMHEAEKMLTQQQTRIYNDELHAIVRIWCGSGTSPMYNCIHATAAHRAEAFLITLNLWK